jgi:hypothetical protein
MLHAPWDSIMHCPQLHAKKLSPTAKRISLSILNLIYVEVPRSSSDSIHTYKLTYTFISMCVHIPRTPAHVARPGTRFHSSSQLLQGKWYSYTAKFFKGVASAKTFKTVRTTTWPLVHHGYLPILWYQCPCMQAQAGICLCMTRQHNQYTCTHAVLEWASQSWQLSYFVGRLCWSTNGRHSG